MRLLNSASRIWNGHARTSISWHAPSVAARCENLIDVLNVTESKCISLTVMSTAVEDGSTDVNHGNSCDLSSSQESVLACLATCGQYDPQWRRLWRNGEYYRAHSSACKMYPDMCAACGLSDDKHDGLCILAKVGDPIIIKARIDESYLSYLPYIVSGFGILAYSCGYLLGRRWVS